MHLWEIEYKVESPRMRKEKIYSNFNVFLCDKPPQHIDSFCWLDFESAKIHNNIVEKDEGILILRVKEWSYEINIFRTDETAVIEYLLKSGHAYLRDII